MLVTSTLVQVCDIIFVDLPRLISKDEIPAPQSRKENVLSCVTPPSYEWICRYRILVDPVAKPRKEKDAKDKEATLI